MLIAIGAFFLLVTLTEVNGQGSGAVYSQECEQTIDNIVSYYACLGLPEHVLSSPIANYEISSAPDNMTCGTNGPTIAYTLGLFTKVTCEKGEHQVSHMVDYNETIDQGLQPNYNSYWQSVTWWDIWDETLSPVTKNEPPKVDITIDFDQRFQLQDDLIITFNSSRPQKMTLYKSIDYGLNWTAWQYFDINCDDLIRSGAAVSRATAANPSAVICTSDYGEQRPYSGGEVRFSVEDNRFALFAGPTISNYEALYSSFENTDILDFLSFTNIRISLEYPASTGDEYLGLQKDLARSWYAISDIELVTTCGCYLHARYCIQDGDQTVCDCQHNTAGKNCEYCKPLYNNRPWRAGSYTPYPSGLANECQKCECYDHAESCYYSTLEVMGICENCTDNTTGFNCQDCVPGFYHNKTLELNDPNTCASCDCELLGVTNTTLPTCDRDGQCDCKSLVQGLKCDECVDTYYGLTEIEPFGTCKGCQCNLQGTVSRSNVCEKSLGQCPCKDNICGRQCSECCQGFYSFPTLVSRGCLDCDCDPGGSYDNPCDPISGQCSCKPGLRGQHCNITDPGTYIPFYDAVQYQPASGTCPRSSDLLSDEAPFTGSEFAVCNTAQSAIFERINGANLVQPTVSWDYNVAIRYTYYSDSPWTQATLSITNAGNSNLQNLPKYQEASAVNLASTCPIGAIGKIVKQETILNLTPGVGEAWISADPISIDARCNYQASITMGNPGTNSSDTIYIDSFVLLPNLEKSAVYNKADNETKEAYIQCQRDIANLLTRETTLYTQPYCNCDGVGAEPEKACEAFGGQCPCKPGVFGRRCDSCQPGFYSFSSSGCTACGCSDLGSENLVCDYSTGQCSCRTNVATATEPNVLNLIDDFQCRSCKTNTFGFHTGEGCTFCNCKVGGTNSSQCDDFGVCPCNPTFNGDKCDTCQEGFFSYSANKPCTPCECNEDGSLGIGCHANTGVCSCKANVKGTKCDACEDGFFNLDSNNPDGCQPCFCYGHGAACTSAEGFAAESVTALNALQWEQTIGGEYFVAPDIFLGNRITSYGTDVYINLRVRGFTPLTLANEKLLVISGGNTETEAYIRRPGTVISNAYETLQIPLRHSEWLYVPPGTQDIEMEISSAEFYKILGNLTSLYVRRTYGAFIVDIYNVTMVTHKESEPGDVEVGFVENCTCLSTDYVDGFPLYMGLSCSECAQGYFRIDGVDDPYAKCQECDCNGNSETVPAVCDALTGECLNCRNGTVGTSCGECAPFVTAPDCEICDDKYWGLSKNGCVPCDCDSIGTAQSSNGVCNKTSGQCECRDETVAGRRCDECADNYYGLSETGLTGCTECNGCYALVQDEVNIIREMRDNLTELVGLITAADQNDELGPFHERLNRTLSNTRTLLSFLTNFNAIESTAVNEINSLNSTLLLLQYHLDTTAQLNLERANISVEAADSATTQGFIVNNDTIFTAQAANSALWGGDIPLYINTVESLVASLKAIEFALGDVSDSSLQDVLRVTQLVGAIEADSNSARSEATGMLTTARDLESTHAVNRQTATSIQNEVTRVSNINTLVTENANTALATALQAEDDADAASTNASSIGSITTDVLSLSFQAVQLRDTAQTLNTRTLQSTVNAQTTINRVKNAQVETNGLLQKVSLAETTSNTLMARMTLAESGAYNASKLANDTIDTAQNMLETMQTFEEKVAAVSAAAAANRAQVTAIEAQSQAVISNATSLSEALEDASTLAQNSVDTATEAKAIATSNRDAMAVVNTDAEALDTSSAGVLNDIDTVYGEVVNANSTTVANARNILNNVEGSVAALQTKTTSAVYKSSNATADTASTKARIAAILEKFGDINQIDESHIVELQALVQKARSDFNNRDLENIVTRYRDAVNENAEMIANMQQRVQTLQQQNARLSTVAAQLRVGKK